MSHTGMIKALDIKHFGCFTGFSWLDDIGDYRRKTPKDGMETFGKLNIIYGQNYSGKTTLSRLIASLEKGEVNPHYEKPEFEIITDKAEEITEHNLRHGWKIKVYNSDFQKENLKWFYDESLGIQPFAILGEENIELQEQIDEIEKKIGKISISLSLKEEKYDSLVDMKTKKIKKLEKDLTDEARKIRDAGDLFKEGNYKKPNLEAALAKLAQQKKVKPLSTEEEKKLRIKIYEQKKEEIECMEGMPLLSVEDWESIRDLLETEIRLNQPIQELVENKILEKWVNEGRDLQTGRKKCIFCGGLLTDEIWEKINNHFSKETEELQSKVLTKQEEVSDALHEINNYIKVDITKISAEYLERMKEENLLFDQEIKKIKKYYQELKDKIQEKIDSPSAMIILSQPPISNINNIIERMNDLIISHNKYCQEIDSEKKKARESLLLEEERKIFERIEYSTRKSENNELSKECDEKELEIKNDRSEIEKQKKMKRELENKLSDETRACNEINRYLRKYFSRDDLTIECNGADQKHGFIIKRSGEEAHHLSEGECSLIAFCYFLGTLYDEKENEDLIIWIDDPISSLDRNHIYAIFSIIDDVIATYKYKQIFISTHNFDFLKFLLEIKLDKKTLKKNFIIESFLTETGKTSKLLKMPKYLSHYKTEFHYLFDQIYSLSMDDIPGVTDPYTRIYDMPNKIRKFLEIYCFFKYPDKRKLDKLLPEIFPVTHKKIYKLINDNSHLTSVERAIKPYDLIEVKEVCDIVLQRVKELDKTQYEGLIRSIQNK